MNTYRQLPKRHPAIKKTYPTCSFQQAQNIIEKRCGNVAIAERHLSEHKQSAPNKVIILPEAGKELNMIVSYGRRSPMNMLEQKFIGLGHIFESGDGHHIIVVNHFIEIHTTNRTSVAAGNIGPNGETTALDLVGYYREEYLEKEAEFNTDENGNLIDPFLTGAGPSEYVLEGHTHPNLHVFFSGPDRESGKARAASDPICIFVCDPIRKEMLGAIGRNMEPTEVIVYSKAPAKQIVEKPIHASPFVPLTPEPRLPQRTETKETVAQTPHNKKEAQSIEDLIGALYARLDNTAGYEVRWKRRRKLGGAIVTKIKIVRQRRRYKIKRRNEYELP